MIYEIFALSCLISGFGLLTILSIIDLKIGLLPNIYNAALAFIGGLFHWMTAFEFLALQDVIIGGVAGGGLLWIIRFVSNRIYKQDTLGLGDVKLLAAGGAWLGVHGILLAITLGAFAGILHSLIALGINHARGKDTGKLSHFSIPAGPGFAVGIFGVGLYQYWGFMSGVFS